MSERQRLRYPELAPEGVRSLSSLEHYLNAFSGLERSLLEMVRLRASQINGCVFCTSLHGQEMSKQHEPAGRVEEVAAWRESLAYTQRERSALRWCEVITNIQDGHAPDEEFTAVQTHFSDREVVDLTLAIASINAWNRLAIAFRPQWHSGPEEAAAGNEQSTPVRDGDDEVGDAGKISSEDRS